MVAAMDTVTVFGMAVRVWRNPTHQGFLRLLQTVGRRLRGSIDLAGNLYVWDASLAVHASIEQALHIDAEWRLVLAGDSVDVADAVDYARLRAHPAMVRAYAGTDYGICYAI